MRSESTSDVSVRIAWPADAPAIAAVQIAAWTTTYDTLLPRELLDALPVDDFDAQWECSITRPTDARQRVLVALDRATIRGFTTTAPSPDDDAHPGQDAELGEIVIEPSARGNGHGSRLLHAAVDTMRADRFSRATTWLASTNDDLRRFLTDQGWAPDGAFRELDLAGDGAVTVKQIRLHTSLVPDEDG
jgi:GNAT superfamily N-acetyltransferase